MRIHVLRITAETPKLLESGEADLLVGFMPELEAGFYQQTLFEQGFACVMRCQHPRVDRRLTEGLYRREKHVDITAPGTGHELVERALVRRIPRQIALSLPTLPGVANLLAHTEFIATVPERIAQMLVKIAQVKALPTAFAMPRFSIKQHWHERSTQDQANKWLRSTVAELFLEG